jgi:Na+/H+ antiporter NhaD/arsenite permease-like protein
MIAVVVALFVLGYIGIVFEHTLYIDKTATALLMAVLCWSAIALLPAEDGIRALETGVLWPTYVTSALGHHLTTAAEILFFLLGAMTIVEMMDAHQAFALWTDKIQTRNAVTLLWIIGLGTFFLSAILDNLTTSIVMASLLRKLVSNPAKRRLYAGAVIISANAGGAFSPIGDITTTMLWIGGQLSAHAILFKVFVPSLVSMVIPLAILAKRLPKTLSATTLKTEGRQRQVSARERAIILYTGLAVLLFVPTFKLITGLPPYMGVLFGMAVVWVVSQFLHRRKPGEEQSYYSAAAALSRTDAGSIMFFLGILLAVGALESLHILEQLAGLLKDLMGRPDLMAYVIGLASAVIDNVPLVAASQGMFSLQEYPMDDALWTYLAYTTGTGGSILIIGSAAGVAVMGIENIHFGWYFRNIGLLALLGYTAGMAVLVALNYAW